MFRPIIEKVAADTEWGLLATILGVIVLAWLAKKVLGLTFNSIVNNSVKEFKELTGGKLNAASINLITIILMSCALVVVGTADRVLTFLFYVSGAGASAPKMDAVLIVISVGLILTAMLLSIRTISVGKK